MAIRAANLAFKTSFALQFRVLCSPGVKRNMAVLCSKGRDFSGTAGPVKYIPKNLRVKRSENSLPVKDFEKRLLDESSEGVRGTVGLRENEKRMRSNSLSLDDSQQSGPVRYAPKNTKVKPSGSSLLVKDFERQILDESSDVERRTVGVHEEAQNWTRTCNYGVSLNDTQQSGTARYISKNSKVEQSEHTLQTKDSKKMVLDRSLGGVITFGLVEEAQYRKQICNKSLLLEDAQASSELEEDINYFGMMDHEVMEEPEEEFKETEFQEENIHKKKVQALKNTQDAEKLAIKLLAKRAFTAVELRRKLLGKRFLPDIVDTVITSFQSRGLINDGLYAETFSRSRWSSSSWGPRRIKQALSKKGVSEADAQKALKLVFEDGQSGEQDTKVGLSKLSMDQLLVQASKQWQRGQDLPKETRRSRLVRWLQYRGFDWSVIGFTMRKLESNNHP